MILHGTEALTCLVQSNVIVSDVQIGKFYNDV